MGETPIVNTYIYIYMYIYIYIYTCIKYILCRARAWPGPGKGYISYMYIYIYICIYVRIYVYVIVHYLRAWCGLHACRRRFFSWKNNIPGFFDYVNSGNCPNYQTFNIYGFGDLSKKTRAKKSWILAVLRPPDLSPRPDCANAPHLSPTYLAQV